MNRSLAIAALATLAASAGVAIVPTASSAAVTTCDGKAVTIVATSDVTKGTEGDDVVAMEPGQWNTFDALGGNDTICLAIGREQTGGRDPQPPSGVLTTGDGDDVVINQMPAGTTGAFTTVALGAGNDTFTGADVGEVVYTDRATHSTPATPLSGPQKDVVTNAAEVYSEAPSDAPNHDRVTFGPRGVRMVLDGPLSPAGLLDFSAAAKAELNVPNPRNLLGGASAEVAIERGARRVLVGNSPAISWTGDPAIFRFGSQMDRTTQPVVSYTGTALADSITIAGVPVGDIDLGEGDDYLMVEAWNDAYIPRSAHGGPGKDITELATTCTSMSIRVTSKATCDGTTGSFAGFEEVIATSIKDLRLIGTPHAERLVANSEKVVVKGLGGADEILVDESLIAKVSGGAGADDIVVQGVDVRVYGQAGKDEILLQGPQGYLPGKNAPALTRRQVAIGGPGRDRLTGTHLAGDRLIGGGGKDFADGRKGRRDVCRAEKKKRCERR